VLYDNMKTVILGRAIPTAQDCSLAARVLTLPATMASCPRSASPTVPKQEQGERFIHSCATSFYCRSARPERAPASSWMLIWPRRSEALAQHGGQ